jgi:hypothetical protein
MNRLRFPVTTFKGWDWPESVASHGFRRGYSQFREHNRNAHVAIRGLESQWESPVLSPAVDSGRCSVAVMQPTESRQGNDLASDRGCRGRNSTAGSVLTESEVGPIFVIVADVIFHQPPQMPLVQNNHVVQ